MILFGTGKIFEEMDSVNTARQSLYGIWDNYGVPDVVATSISNGQSALQSQSLSVVDEKFYSVTANPVNWATKRGWYIDLNRISGERLTINPEVLYEQVVFTTIIPGSTSDPCVNDGMSTTFQLNALTGAPLDYRTIDTNGDGIVDATDAIVSGRQGALTFGLTIMEKGKKAIIYQANANNSSGNPSLNITESDKIVLPTVRLWRQIIGKN
jgi:type IV pilus assembly protein PilY1